MQSGKIKPTATIVAQFAAGVEVEAIQHEGKLFLPVVGLGEFAASEDAPAKTPKTSPAKKTEPEAEEEASETTTYSKDELMDMDTKELIKILKNDYGINPNDFDGKNTNKKLRDLILDAQKGGGKTSEDEEEEKEAPKKGKGKSSKKEEEPEASEHTEAVAEILEDFDAGKKNKKKTIAAIVALVDDADEDEVSKLVDEFEDDTDADIDEAAELIAKVLAGEAPKKGKKSPAKSKKGKKEEELVEVDDLEKGDRVSVWWDDDYQEWYDGEVKSIKKGVVTIAYDDDTEEVIDPEVHTKIKRLEE